MADLYDEAYDVLDDPTVVNDAFSDLLRTHCSFGTDVRRILYSSDVTSLRSLAESFPTHLAMDLFIKDLSKMNGREMTVARPHQDDGDEHYKFILRFPALQQLRLRALRLLAISRSYSDVAFDVQAIDAQTMKPFMVLAVSVTTAKLTSDIPEMGIPVLPAQGNPADNYSLWRDRFVDFIGAYRSCYTGAPLSYLLRDDEAPPHADTTDFETFDQYLVAMVSFEQDINLAFPDENKVLASVLSRALGSNNPIANDLAAPIRLGQGRLVWDKLKVRINGTAQAFHSRVSTLENKLKTPFTGKGQRSIQTHNSMFNKTVQDLATAGGAITTDRQIREYLMTIVDPSLVSLKDTVRFEKNFTLDNLQERFVDVMEGRLADMQAHQAATRSIKSVRQSSNRRGRKEDDKKTNSKNGKRKASTPAKGKTKSERVKMTEEEVTEAKASNPDEWFLTDKTIPQKHFKELTLENKKALLEWRGDRTVKAARMEIVQDKTVVAPTVDDTTMDVDNQPPVQRPSRAEEVANANATYASILKTMPVTTSTAPSEAKPTVQFGRGAHPTRDVQKQDE